MPILEIFPFQHSRIFVFRTSESLAESHPPLGWIQSTRIKCKNARACIVGTRKGIFFARRSTATIALRAFKRTAYSRAALQWRTNMQNGIEISARQRRETKK